MCICVLSIERFSMDFSQGVSVQGMPRQEAMSGTSPFPTPSGDVGGDVCEESVPYPELEDSGIDLDMSLHDQEVPTSGSHPQCIAPETAASYVNSDVQCTDDAFYVSIPRPPRTPPSPGSEALETSEVNFDPNTTFLDYSPKALTYHVVALPEPTLHCDESAGEIIYRPLRPLYRDERIKRARQVDHAGFAPYSTAIYLHRRSNELKYHPKLCLANQPQITSGMRSLLVQWLTKLNHQYQFYPDTLCLSINIIDRFLSMMPISRDCLQLLGITAFLVAAKMEEIYPPEIAGLLKLCYDEYNREQVKQLELIVLSKLKFDLLIPTTTFFLEYHASSRLSSTNFADCTLTQARRTRAMARYLVEVGLSDYKVSQYPPSLLALAALELSDQTLQQCTRPGSMHYGGYGMETMEECFSDLRMLTAQVLESISDLDIICEQYLNIYNVEDY